MTAARQVRVNLAGAAHDITIEPGVLARVGPLVAQVAPGPAALLVMDEKIADDHGAVALDSLRSAGFTVATATLTARESLKTLQTVRALYDTMLAGADGATLDRGSPVVALGGGIVGDTAGFAAATYMRGVPLIQVPTTLLAMVDAAIGGKTGVNVPLPDGGLGKNLVGAFWQPRAVVTDPTVLATLATRELRCGLGECIKHAIITDDGRFAFLERNAEAIQAGHVDTLTELITRSAAVKIDVVRGDEREAGGRAVLNLGHTFAHAIETFPALDVHHGEAVAIGLVAAAACAVATDRLDAADAARIESLIRLLGLPATLPDAVAVDRAVAAMQYDKKVAGGRLRLVLPCAIGRVEIADDVPIEIVRDAWRRVGAC